ncbi:MAG: LytTR family DNA-binding domain-containing protein [Oscillospiraceae bacterium]
MNIAIVEDDAADREYLLDCLAIHADDTKVAMSISSFENATVFLESGSPGRYDLIFLDIYMGNVTGMELAQKLRDAHVSSQIVFVTTSVSHAVTSYEVAATYYLLKPYDYEQFFKMMQTVYSRRKVDEPTIGVKVGHDLETLPLSAIRYVDYADHYVQIHTNTKLMRSYMPFAELEEQLRSFPQFLTCYRNVIVNMDRIEKLEGDHFELEQGESIPISRNRVREMREAYTGYIFFRMKRGGMQ